MDKATVSVSDALRAAAGVVKDSHTAKLIELAELWEKRPTLKNAKKVKCQAMSIAYSYPAEGPHLIVYYAAYAAECTYIAVVYAHYDHNDRAAVYAGFAAEAARAALRTTSSAVAGFVPLPPTLGRDARPHAALGS